MWAQRNNLQPVPCYKNPLLTHGAGLWSAADPGPPRTRSSGHLSLCSRPSGWVPISGLWTSLSLAVSRLLPFRTAADESASPGPGRPLPGNSAITQKGKVCLSVRPTALPGLFLLTCSGCSEIATENSERSSRCPLPCGAGMTDHSPETPECSEQPRDGGFDIGNLAEIPLHPRGIF